MANRTTGQDSLGGQAISHYRVIEKIGAGGMGEVYRARDEHLDRDVAIKVLPPGTLGDESARRHFRKEALVLSRLNHPNIATIHDFDTQQGVDFLVMEYIPGITLGDKLANRPLPEKEIINLGTQLVEGLSAAHEHGVVHRDLKPGNLRLTDDGRMKILDFGLAKLRLPLTPSAATESMSETQGVAGTLPYMAPEQILGGDIDARTDIHAAGAVLYEMATGQQPFAQVERSQLIGAILHRPPMLPTALNPRISPELERIIGKCLEKEPENRYQSAKELAIDLRRMAASGSTMQAAPARRTRGSWAWRAATVVLGLGVLLVAGGLFFHARRAHVLTPSDTIVLADFLNTTGDPVFDDALKQALTVQLEQSPFLNILPETKVQDTLRLMGHSASERLTPELGRDLCQRTGGKALLAGSVAALGSQYVVGLKATVCSSGSHVASEQVEAVSKEDVLKALGKAASSLRSKLGESLGSLQKFDVPIEEVTTPSLDALKAYSLGRKAMHDKGNLAAIPFLERAVELDPNFAMAYTGLAVSQFNLGRDRQGRDAAGKAFALRDRVSERERFRISAYYYESVPRDLERAVQVYRQWAETYPNDVLPHIDMGSFLPDLGRWGEAAAEEREAVRLDPSSAVAYANLALSNLGLSQLDSAEAVIEEAQRHSVNAVWLRPPMYYLAFIRQDTKKMEQLLQEAAGKEDETGLLSAQSDTEAYYGRVTRSRAFSRRAVESELREESKEAAAMEHAYAALREAELGGRELSRERVAAALAEAPDRDVMVLSALALARIGDTARAKVISQKLQKDNPSNTILNGYWLPTINAAVEIKEGRLDRALAILEPTLLYELAGEDLMYSGPLYPAYLRGQAYLMMHNGPAAAAEFQKLLDHRGIVLNYSLGALAHLQLGRAYAMQGDTAKAKAAYQNFLALWKEADPDISILKQAKGEYAKLQ